MVVRGILALRGSTAMMVHVLIRHFNEKALALCMTECVVSISTCTGVQICNNIHVGSCFFYFYM